MAKAKTTVTVNKSTKVKVAAPKKGKSRLTKIFGGCLGVFVVLIIIGALLPGKKPDTSVALVATGTSRPDIRDTPTDAPAAVIAPTVVRASSGFVTITPAPGTVYPTATITDTPQPTVTNTDSPTETPAPQVSPIANELYDVIGTANARSCPASTCDLIGKFQSGSTIPITGIVSGENYKNSPLWMQTIYDNGQTVYVHSSLVTPHRDYVQPTAAQFIQQSIVQPSVNIPSGATAKCNDGTYWYAAEHRGACSGHKGVETFYTP